MDLIIGAGVTGLTFANFTRNPYLILEADDHTGGLCNTIRQDGFVWDYSGHFFHFQHPQVAEFMSSRINAEELALVRKHTQIRYRDRYVDFPFQKNIHQLEQQEFIDCLCDLFECGEIPVTSFKSMLYARFGRSIAEKFLIPYNEKLYATDLDRLDEDAMGRFFPFADKEEIIRNFRHRDDGSYNGTFLYPRGGAIQYVKALERDIAADAISLNERVEEIDLPAHQLKTDRRTIRYDHLVSTIPFVRLLDLCRLPYDREALSWNKVLVFNLGFDRPSTDRANHWIYYPEKKYCFYRVGFYSNIIPSDRMSLYVETGFSQDAEVHVEKVFASVMADLEKAGVVTDQQLVSSHHVLMDPAYVHVSQRGMAEVVRQKGLLAAQEVYSIGRYGSWCYSSIEDNMLEAIALADQLTAGS